jgi:hypothetical protein
MFCIFAGSSLREQKTGQSLLHMNGGAWVFARSSEFAPFFQSSGYRFSSRGADRTHSFRLIYPATTAVGQQTPGVVPVEDRKILRQGDREPVCRRRRLPSDAQIPLVDSWDGARHITEHARLKHQVQLLAALCLLPLARLRRISAALATTLAHDGKWRVQFRESDPTYCDTARYRAYQALYEPFVVIRDLTTQQDGVDLNGHE